MKKLLLPIAFILLLLQSCDDASKSNTLNGKFSVSNIKQVCFSKGNLQYQPSSKTWRFAEHQWDYIGADNENISSSYNGWIDLFGWGTSGYNGKSPCMVSTMRPDYETGKSSISGTSFDWGVYNTISNGGSSNWRTLTEEEWKYVFDTRNTNSGVRYAKAVVNEINGIILLPDNWNSSFYNLASINQKDASFSSNRISQSDWTSKLEVNGAVFLPAAGFRYGNAVSRIGYEGLYWSATDYDIYNVYFGDGYVSSIRLIQLNHSGGRSVRLICDVNN